MTKINKTIAPEYAKQSQPIGIVRSARTLEEGVRDLLSAAKRSQTRLHELMNLVVEQLLEQGNKAILYDPGVKSYKSALRKAKHTYGNPNMIRQLTDVYRGSIVIGSRKTINSAIELTKSSAAALGFTIVYFKDTFKTPWEDGYRDVNMRLKDTKNHGLIGELQVHLCTVKKFTEIVGHKSYEILREMPDGDTKQAVKKYLNELTRYGYTNTVEWPEVGCIEELKIRDSRRKKTSKATKKRETKRKTEKKKKTRKKN